MLTPTKPFFSIVSSTGNSFPSFRNLISHVLNLVVAEPSSFSTFVSAFCASALRAASSCASVFLRSASFCASALRAASFCASAFLRAASFCVVVVVVLVVVVVVVVVVLVVVVVVIMVVAVW